MRGRLHAGSALSRLLRDSVISLASIVKNHCSVTIHGDANRIARLDPTDALVLGHQGRTVGQAAIDQRALTQSLDHIGQPLDARFIMTDVRRLGTNAQGQIALWQASNWHRSFIWSKAVVAISPHCLVQTAL